MLTAFWIIKHGAHTATMLLRSTCDVKVSTSMLRQVFVQLTRLAHVTVSRPHLQWVCIQCLVSLKHQQHVCVCVPYLLMLLLLVWSSQQSPYREQLQIIFSHHVVMTARVHKFFFPLCRLLFLTARLPTAGWTGAAVDAGTRSCSVSAADVSSSHKSPGLQVQKKMKTSRFECQQANAECAHHGHACR